MKFTKSGIDALTCPPGKRDVMFTDSEVKGFAIRVNATGSKTFVFNYRFGGKGRRLVLGQYGELTLAHARKLAEAARGKVMAGGHPAEEKKAVAQAFQQQAIEDARQAAANALTFEVLIDRWTCNALRDSSESHRTEAPRRLRLNFADMLNRPAHALTVAEVQTRLDDVAEKHPTTARRLLSYGRALYSWAVKRQLVEENPFAHVVVEGREVSRDRVLTDAELGAAWRAACQMPYAFGPFFRLLVLTLQRRSEVAGMRWEEITPDLTTWTIPASRTKNGKEHIVHLSEPARQVLASLHRQTDSKTGAVSPFVFTNTGRTPISGFSDGKERLEALMEQERATNATRGPKNAGKKPSALPASGWRLHDLRRTGVTTMARLGIGPHVADKVLNHTEGAISGVAAVYQRHEFLKERASALDAWATHVLKIVENLEIEQARSNIIKFR